ncbi:DUF2079 domain-containing protein [Actinomyces israelii]|uniref:DUF2079 domain-containing protein n=1 Tax=Actinomyces israelii TaxID=1659 RepID=A0ABT4ICU5_9ACTO|nr:DUF2079 domain-containing protein [Actinomyces israelii]MCZ0859565.1 DUF2079 domain-containing protein [Actinomyces israelii]
MITPRPFGQTARDAATRRLSAALDRLPAALVVVVGAWVLIAYSVGQWRSLTVPSWDLAIFAELAKDYAHGQAPIVSIKGDGYNLLGDHFHPILVLLGPVWRLFPTPLALLVVQDLLLAVSAWPLTRLATRLTRRSVATALGLFYVLSWGIQGAVQAQFHEIAFAVPALAWASVAFVERRWRACALWLAPLVLVKEDMGLTLVMAGGAMALRGWQDARAGRTDDDGGWARWLPGRSAQLSGRSARTRAGMPTAVRVGAYVALFGLLAFVLTVFVIVPLLSPTGAWQYGLNGNAADGMPTVPNHGNLLDRLFSPQVKVATLFMLVCTAGGIGLASPWMTLVLPTLGWRFLADKETYWEWRYWHYNAVLIPIALGALLDVVARLRERRARRAGEPPEKPTEATGATEPAGPTGPATHAGPTDPAGPTAPGNLAGSADSAGAANPAGPAGWLAAPVWARWVVAVGVVIPLIAGVKTAPHLPLWTMKDRAAQSTRWDAAQQVIDTIPEGASVETDLTLLAYLVPKADVSWVGASHEAKDYVVIDSRSTAWGGRIPRDAAQWAAQNRHAAYQLVLDVDGFQVAKRVG